MKRKSLVFVGLLTMLAIVFFACTNPLDDKYSYVTDAQNAYNTQYQAKVDADEYQIWLTRNAQPPKISDGLHFPEEIWLQIGQPGPYVSVVVEPTDVIAANNVQSRIRIDWYFSFTNTLHNFDWFDYDITLPTAINAGSATTYYETDLGSENVLNNTAPRRVTQIKSQIQPQFNGFDNVYFDGLFVGNLYDIIHTNHAA